MTQGPEQYGGQDPQRDDRRAEWAWGAEPGSTGQFGHPQVQDPQQFGNPQFQNPQQFQDPHQFQDPQQSGQYGPAQGFPAQGPSGAPTPYPPGQGYPQQPYPGQPYPGQPYPGQPYPGQVYPGQVYPGRPGPWPAGDPLLAQNAATGYAYPMPGRSLRPGAVTAAAVLAFVQAGFLLFAGLAVFAGADVADLAEGTGVGLDDEFTVVALATWLATGLLVAGGAQVLNGRRGLLAGGCILSLLISLYWLVRMADTDVFARGLIAWPFLFAVLPIISLSLANTAVVKQWIATRLRPV